MRKAIKAMSLIAAMLMIVGLLAGCATGSSTAQQETTTAEQTTTAPATEAATTQAETTTAAPAQQNSGSGNTEGIGEDAALDIALKDAGFAKSDVTNPWVELDMDDGRYEYDVKFYKDATEYEYTIDANSGTILEKDIGDD